jgi:hypothetical protein
MAQWMAAIELIRPVARDQHHRLAAQVADQEREQIAGGPIGPVQILEHQNQRGRSGEPSDQIRGSARTISPAPACHPAQRCSPDARARARYRQAPRRPEQLARRDRARADGCAAPRRTGRTAAGPPRHRDSPPTSPTAPRAWARETSSSMRRVFPIPASPATRNAADRPAAAAASPCSR